MTYYTKIPICLQTSNKYQRFPNGSLLIRHTDFTDEMYYSCVAQNDQGTEIKTVSLIVTGKVFLTHNYFVDVINHARAMSGQWHHVVESINPSPSCRSMNVSSGVTHI